MLGADLRTTFSRTTPFETSPPSTEVSIWFSGCWLPIVNRTACGVHPSGAERRRLVRDACSAGRILGAKLSEIPRH